MMMMIFHSLRSSLYVSYGWLRCRGKLVKPEEMGRDIGEKEMGKYVDKM